MVGTEIQVQLGRLRPIHCDQLIVVGASDAAAVQEQVEFGETGNGGRAVREQLHVARRLGGIPCCRCRPAVRSAPVAMALRNLVRSALSSGVSVRRSSARLPAETRSATWPKDSWSSGRKTVRRATARPMPGSRGRGGTGVSPKLAPGIAACGVGECSSASSMRGSFRVEGGRCRDPGPAIYSGYAARKIQDDRFWRGFVNPSRKAPDCGPGSDLSLPRIELGHSAQASAKRWCCSSKIARSSGSNMLGPVRPDKSRQKSPARYPDGSCPACKGGFPQGRIDIADADDAGREGNAVSLEAMRITGAVPAFVMAERHVGANREAKAFSRSAPRSGWVRARRRSSGVSAVGLLQIEAGRSSLPTSCHQAA